MPVDASALENLIEGTGRPEVYPTGEFLGHLITQIGLHLQAAENGVAQRSEHHRKMAETYAAVYRAVRP